MVWGRSHAARKAPDVDLADMTKPHAGAVGLEGLPRRAECAGCETAALLVEGALPAGWVVVDGELLCHDCIRSRAVAGHQDGLRTNGLGTAEADLAAATARRPVDVGTEIATRVRHVVIGPRSSSYAGCRIKHQFAFGFVGLRIHAGWQRPHGRRDDPINFMLDRRALKAMIAHLQEIEAEFDAAPGAAKGGK